MKPRRDDDRERDAGRRAIVRRFGSFGAAVVLGGVLFWGLVDRAGDGGWPHCGRLAGAPARRDRVLSEVYPRGPRPASDSGGRGWLSARRGVDRGVW